MTFNFYQLIPAVGQTTFSVEPKTELLALQLDILLLINTLSFIQQVFTEPITTLAMIFRVLGGKVLDISDTGLNTSLCPHGVYSLQIQWVCTSCSSSLNKIYLAALLFRNKKNVSLKLVRSRLASLFSCCYLE